MPPRFDLKLVEFEFFKDCEEITKKKLPEICLLKTFWRVLDSINLYGKSRKGGRLSFFFLRQTHMCRPAAGYGFRIKSLNRVIPLLNVVNRFAYLDQQPVVFKVSNKVVNFNSAPGRWRWYHSTVHVSSISILACRI